MCARSGWSASGRWGNVLAVGAFQDHVKLNYFLAGYLGGAVGTRVRVGDRWLLFPAVMGALAWAGLWCRSPRLRELLPLS